MENFEDWTHRRLVQPPTFAHFAHDQHTAFAAVNKVDLCFSLDVPLSSEIKAWDIDPDLLVAEEDEDVASEAPADGKTLRETDDGMVYETTDSQQKCTWLLFPQVPLPCYWRMVRLPASIQRHFGVHLLSPQVIGGNYAELTLWIWDGISPCMVRVARIGQVRVSFPGGWDHV